MERILLVFLFVSLTSQAPIPDAELENPRNTLYNDVGLEQLPVRDSGYYCPFTHPSVRHPNSTTPDLFKLRPERPDFLGSFFDRQRRSVQLKTKYVSHSGQILSYTNGQPMIRVDATVHVSDYALEVAATTIKKMTMHMPTYLFNSCASNTKVGVFTKAESLTVFPEFSSLASPPGCGSSCAGHCHSQCTFDGRPYSSLAGTGGSRAVIVDNNVLCNAQDPYYKQDNILVHEYAHTIKDYCLTSSLKQRITAAYQNAKARSIWSNQYAMATEHEYWAIGTETWFNSMRTTYASGGMNVCSGQACTTANAARWNLYNKDVTLYGLLLEVYFNGNVNVVAGMLPCTHLH